MAGVLTEWGPAERRAGETITAAWEGFFKSKHRDAIERSEEIQETARIAEVQAKCESELLALEGVVGAAPSLKMTKGKPTKNWCLSVLVEKKRPEKDVPKASLVPSNVDGVQTDVLETGKIEPLVFNARVRPALPGFSIGHHNITAGTFGCLVRDIRHSVTEEEPLNDYLILSNNHVLADSNRGKPGDLIVQPGPIDGGAYPADGIATLDRFEPIVCSFPNGYNLVDAAVARLTFSRNVTASIIGLVIPRAVDQAFIGSLVVKVGRTTQVTIGRVLAVNATVFVGPYDCGTAVFRHQIITTSMAAGGDSGSLLMDSNLSAVGLLFAGSSRITIHNHIADVETALGVRPITASRSG